MSNITRDYVKDLPWSFGGKYRLYELYKKKKVDKALVKSDIYTRFKQHRK